MMMDATFTTMPSVDLCDHIGGATHLLQLQSSDSGSSVAGSPPLMHTLQPLLSDTADSLADFVNNLPKHELELATSVAESFSCLGDNKMSSMQSYAATPVSTPSADVGVEFSCAASASSDPAVPCQISVPVTTDFVVSQPQCYLQPVDVEKTEPTNVNRTLLSASSSPCHPVVNSSDGVLPDSGAGDSLAFGSPVPSSSKPDLPAPPKKPLTPYMRFSKGIWQQVKGSNPGLSVCEVGATIGRMWRELNEAHKQRFNEDFANDKARYDGELQCYLLANGLQSSSQMKTSRGKKKDSKDKSAAAAASASNGSRMPQVPPASNTSLVNVDNGVSLTPEQIAEEMARTILESAGMAGEVGGLTDMGSEAMKTTNDMRTNGFLPHFSQVWSSQEMLFNGTEQVSAAVATAPGMCVPSILNIPSHMASVGNLQASPLCSNMVPADGNVIQPTAANQQLHMTPFELGTLPLHDQQHLANVDPAAWLWSQIGVGNLDLANGKSNSSLNTTDPQPMTGNGSVMQNGISSTVELPSAYGNLDILEPGEVRMPGAGENIVDGIKDDHAMSELMLLREALTAKGKEAARLTRELELAYELIQRLQQQNLAYQQLEWNFQQQQQQTQLLNDANSLVSSLQS